LSQESVPAAGRVATYGLPSTVSVTVTAGVAAAVIEPAGAAAGTIGKVLAAGMFAETTANLIEPSGQRTFTSVCVGSFPTCTASLAAPWGSGRPNVAHPFVKI
jgi:hypothetical protein